jgi:hypothetical protein
MALKKIPKKLPKSEKVKMLKTNYLNGVINHK